MGRNGRAVLVTGTSRTHGIGAGAARRLAEVGWDVGLTWWLPGDAGLPWRGGADEPGPNDTGWMTPETRWSVLAETPMGRLGRPSDTAALVAFLCSEDAGWITGQILRSDGGFRLA